VQERYARAIYGDHPGSRIFPSVEAIDKVTREALIDFHRTHYVPDKAIVAVVGDITFAEAKSKIEKALGVWKKTQQTLPPVQNPAALKESKVYLVDRPNSVQTSLIIATQAIDRMDPEYDILSMLNTIIGGGPTGRLFLNLREEKGWTYGAYSNLDAPRYRGAWLAQAEVRGDVTEAAVGEILNEINRARTELVPDKEFLDKKRSLVASFALSLESPGTILSNYVTSRQYGFPADYWDRYPERIMAVTKEQVKEAAAKYLDPAHIQVVAVGDGKKISEGLKKFGSVEIYDTEGKPKSVP
jgi:predicted Zn-dependent peptidase